MYDMLGDMELENTDDEPPAAFCLQTETKIGRKKIPVFQFLMDPRELLKIATVARRERPHEKFYQRTVEEKRLLEIAKFLAEGNVTPNNIVVGMEPEAWKDAKFSSYTFTGNTRAGKLQKEMKKNTNPTLVGTLTFPRKYRSCWVIDGQHRLYGIAKREKISRNTERDIVNKKINLPIIAFGNIQQDDMAKMFLDINAKQKKISPDFPKTQAIRQS